MKKFKTNLKYRDTYRYSFVDGSSKEIVVDDEVTAENIAFLHQLDDEAVDAERRESYHIPIHYGYFKAFDREENHLLGAELSPLELFWKAQNHDRKKQEQLFQKLRDAIITLTPNQQKLIQLIYFEGKSLTEVAKNDDVYVSSIHKRLKRIHHQLRKKMIQNF
ncbi:sigma factor-like helix-turn-helix DNA-binding protein [Lactococcus lactis]